MRACPTDEELRALQLGDLAEPLLSEVADHVAACPRCETRAQDLDTVVDPFLTALRASDHPAEARTRMLRFSGTVGPQQVAEVDLSFLEPPSQPGEIGRLANYRVLDLLGVGGMSHVFHAEDLTLKRPVALKVMRFRPDPEGCQRFLREARLLAGLKHPNLVTVYHAGQEGKVVYLAMELLHGQSLESWLQAGERPDQATLLRLARGIAEGLAEVHRHGLIHRDIKPANIWLEAPSGQVKILDFGLARHVRDEAGITRAGTIIGTPSYMSPEQARGDRVDARTDLFSLGCVLYRLATGALPFRGDDTMAALTALAVDSPKPLQSANPDLPAPLADLIMQLLAKKPEDRPASVEEVLERLERIDKEPHAPARPVRRPVPSRRAVSLVMAGAVLLLAGLALWQWRPRSAPPPPGELWPPPPPAGSVFLTDLKPIEAENWPFDPRKDRFDDPFPFDPKKRDRGPPDPFTKVRFRNRLSPHGIFMHPPIPPREGPVALTYRLGGEFAELHAAVGLNDGPEWSEQPLTFAVYGDGTLLWQSREVIGPDDAQLVRVPVGGVNRLKIEVSCPPGHVRGSHAVWIEPYLAR